RAFGYAIPLTYFLEYYRGFHGVPVSEGALVKGYVLSAVYLAVIYMLHFAAIKRAKRIGTILKLSE
ncbi:MAG TPA: hypothetical protein PLQ76_03585, partial [bacterium]|nr:hypothetical protein [bacterium]